MSAATPSFLMKVPVPDIGCVQQSNERVWGSRHIWPALEPLQRLLLSQEPAPVLFGALVHQSVAERSAVLVGALKSCIQSNPAVREHVQELLQPLKADRLERLDLIKEAGDIAGVPCGAVVITRIVLPEANPRG